MGRRDLLDDAGTEAALQAVAWERDGDAIVRTVKLPTFPAAIEFVRQVADIAEAMDHHPDIDIRWRTVRLRSSTHSAGGLTDLDFALARAVDQLRPPGSG
jgi:4a-hydroxytetrahydrobiopterin dehydratase